jgi:hypothetical protein
MNQTKLSKLQKWVLLAAYEKIEHPVSPMSSELPPSERTLFVGFFGASWGWIDPKTHNEAIKEWRSRRGPESKLTRHEVIMRYYGFPERGPRSWPRNQPIIDRRGRQAAFNVANASLSRALKRLAERGLVRDRSYSGDIELTTDGIEVAKDLKRLHGRQLSRM